jgi:DNA-directed RNA polymerase specialized sigma24 family protein
MNIATHKEDLVLAQETCLELRSGNNDAILPVYRKYQSMFMGYTRRRVHSSDDDRATSILTDFWVELLNAKAICNFQGLSSLKTYLFKILNFRIIDNVRKPPPPDTSGNTINGGDNDVDGTGGDGVSPEEEVIQKEKIRLIHETLLMLTESSPTDAYWVKLHFEEMSYQQMAEKSLAGTSYSDKELKKKTTAIKKQFTRKTSGSMAKFKSCLERVMRKNNLDLADILNK